MHPANSPDEWFTLAREKAETARLLMVHGRHSAAYQYAGLAYECALKGRVMRALGLNQWPPERHMVWTHDLTRLAALSGALPALQAFVSQGDGKMGIVWLVAKDWRIDLRYVPEDRFPAPLASDMVRGLLAGGLLEWLME